MGGVSRTGRHSPVGPLRPPARPRGRSGKIGNSSSTGGGLCRGGHTPAAVVVTKPGKFQAQSAEKSGSGTPIAVYPAPPEVKSAFSASRLETVLNKKGSTDSVRSSVSRDPRDSAHSHEDEAKEDIMPLFGFLKSKVSKKESPAEEEDSDTEITPAPVAWRTRRSVSFSSGEVAAPRRRRAFDMASDGPSERRGVPSSQSFQEGLRLNHSSSDNGVCGMPGVARRNHLLGPDKFCEVVEWRDGSDSKLFRACELSTGRVVMVKIFDRKIIIPSQEAQVYSEHKILEKTASVPGTIAFYSFFEDTNHMGLMFAQDLRPSLRGFLKDVAHPMAEATVLSKLAAPLTLVLNDLHKIGIIHRTVSPATILFSDDRSPVLGEFGSAVDTRHDNSGDVQPALPNYRIGELAYMAPEVAASPTADEMFHEVVFKGMAEEELPMYNERVDIFSFGVILFQMLSGDVPFKHACAAELQKNVRGADFGQLISQRCSGLSSEGRDFLQRCLVADPEKRATAAELLEHAWLKPEVGRAKEYLEAGQKFLLGQKVDPEILRSKARFDLTNPTRVPPKRSSELRSRQSHSAPNWESMSGEKAAATVVAPVHNGLAKCATSHEVLTNNPFTF